MATKQDQLEEARFEITTKLNATDTKCRIDLLLGFCWFIADYRKVVENSNRVLQTNKVVELDQVVQSVEVVSRIIARRIIRAWLSWLSCLFVFFCLFF
jgi:hypothetical protein